MKRAPWGHGARGEWYVVAQVALMLLVIVGPRSWGGWPLRPIPFPWFCRIAGITLIAVGGFLFLAGIIRLGRNLTPLPYPRRNAILVHTGAYRFVRHPMYGGGALIAFGWALLVRSWLTLLYAAILFAFIDVKSRREERWLRERFPEYADYARRVRRLIPFLY